MNIVVVGSINMDSVIQAPRIPLPGETIKGIRDFMVPGGKGANQAVAASRLNAHVEMIGSVGDDQIGETLLSNLKEEKIGIDNIFITPNSQTGKAFITISEKGDNSIVLSPGANEKLTPSMIQQRKEVIKNANLVLVQMEIPIKSVEETIYLANKYNVPVILNPAPAIRLSPEILKRIDILTPNETEGKLLLGQNADSNLNAEQIISGLLSLGIKKVILTQGKDGVSYNENNQIFKLPSFKVNVVDTTAAGDSFNAGLAVSLAEGKSYYDAINFSQKVAAHTITNYGAIPSLPFRKQLEIREDVQ